MYVTTAIVAPGPPTIILLLVGDFMTFKPKPIQVHSPLMRVSIIDKHMLHCISKMRCSIWSCMLYASAGSHLSQLSFNVDHKSFSYLPHSPHFSHTSHAIAPLFPYEIIFVPFSQQHTVFRICLVWMWFHCSHSIFFLFVMRCGSLWIYLSFPDQSWLPHLVGPITQKLT